MNILDPDRAYAALIEAGEHWADTDAAASLLEETRRSCLADLMIGCDEKSIAAKETWALAAPVYKEHVERMCEARRVANIAKVRYAALQVLAEMRRSQESTRRAELQAGISSVLK